MISVDDKEDEDSQISTPSKPGCNERKDRSDDPNSQISTPQGRGPGPTPIKQGFVKKRAREINLDDDDEVEEVILKRKKVGKGKEKEKERKIKVEEMLRYNKHIVHSLSNTYKELDGEEPITISDSEIKTPSVKQRKAFKKVDGGEVSFSSRVKAYPLLRKFSPNESVDMTEINGVLDGLDEPDFQPEEGIPWSKCRHLWANKVNQLEHLLNEMLLCFPESSVVCYLKNR